MSLPSSDHSDGRTYKWYRGKVPAPFLFGEGATYTTFSLNVSTETSSSDIRSTEDTTVYTTTIVNTGKFPAQQTVMLFAKPVSVPDAPAGPLPVRQLFDFARTPTLAPVQADLPPSLPVFCTLNVSLGCCLLTTVNHTPHMHAIVGRKGSAYVQCGQRGHRDG